MDRNALPKGHIVGWVPPSSETKVTVPGADSDASGSKPLSKSAAKNAKRRAKKQAEKEKIIKESWEDDDEDEPPKTKGAEAQGASSSEVAGDKVEKTEKSDETNGGVVEALAEVVGKLDMR